MNIGVIDILLFDRFSATFSSDNIVACIDCCFRLTFDTFFPRFNGFRFNFGKTSSTSFSLSSDTTRRVSGVSSHGCSTSAIIVGRSPLHISGIASW